MGLFSHKEVAMGKRKTHITRHHFNLYSDQVKALRALAYKEGTTHGTQVRKALDELLQRKGYGPFPDRRLVRR